MTPQGPFVLDQTTIGCLDGFCEGEIVRKVGKYYLEVRVWRIIYTPRKHFYFPTKEKALKFAQDRGLELVER